MKQLYLLLTILLLQLASYSLAANPNVKTLKASTDAKAKEKANKIKQEQFMKQLYNANSLSEMTKLGLIQEKSSLKPAGIQGRANLNLPAALTLRDDSKDATPGKCDPKPVCISNPLTLNITSSNQIVFPPCINIHRCDGCCPTNEVCTATKTTEVKLSKVYIINYDAENSSSEEKYITVSNHTDCECRCKWENDKDCKSMNPNYVKDPYSCNCICPEELICGPYHESDTESCACICKRSVFSKIEQTCRSRGYSWNDTSCKCEAPIKPK